MRRHPRKTRGNAAFALALASAAAVALGAVPPSAALAASAALSLSPASGSYAVGSTFTVSVMLDSGGGVGVNAADGVVSFDPSLLSVQSVSKDNSVFNLWTSNPSFSNTAGTVNYSGGSNNAYAGNAGDIIDIVFKVLSAGTANVKFNSASALAADGQGTEILGGTTGATFTTGGSAPASPPATTPAPPSSASSNSSASSAASSGGASFAPAITVSSPTDPDPTQWYDNNSPNFTWTLTPDVAGVSTAFDQNPGTYPPRTSAGLISSKQYSNVKEGAWYFHVRFEDAIGDWSDPVTYEVQIDVTPPLPFTVTAEPGAGVSGRTLLLFNATDTVSGVDHYLAIFDGGSSTTIALSDVQNGIYTAPPLLPGKHLVTIRAFDKAGNFIDEDVDFSISGIAMPDITNFPATVIEESPIVLEGIADSGSNVTVDVDDSAGKVVSEGRMVADETGHWLYAIESGLSSGKYSLNVMMVTTQGAIASTTASSTNGHYINVLPAPFLDRFGWALIVLLLACIAGLTGYGFYRKKLFDMQMLLANRENAEARDKTRAVFEALREEMSDEVNHMQGGAAEAQGEAKLEPEQVIDSMRNALVVSETMIQKELDDVEKALNEDENEGKHK